MSDLYELIVKSRNGDSTATLDLVTKFQPLLQKYKFKLKYEDAYYDLLLALLEALKFINPQEMKSSTDASILAYINRSVYHAYIALSKRNKENSAESTIFLPEMCDDDNAYTSIWDRLLFTQDDYRQIEFDFLFTVLTKREAEIVILSIYFKYPLKEIANMYGSSLPAICQSKKSAIYKLKKPYKL